MATEPVDIAGAALAVDCLATAEHNSTSDLAHLLQLLRTQLLYLLVRLGPLSIGAFSSEL